MDALFQEDIEVSKQERHHLSMKGASIMKMTIAGIDLAKKLFKLTL
ncbi:hypothetical protein [Actimicrobium sp. CCI2.3]|nr:hypothetical protein [Actimicrobium sp. CCI2.3]